MFWVIFEVHPGPDQWDAYLGHAKMLRPELEQVDGFINNVRHRSLARGGWILSLSGWRDEKAVVRWRPAVRHPLVQEKGRSEILLDYHLRVGQVTQDTRVPDGHVLRERRLDETEVGEGTAVALIDAKRPSDWPEAASALDIAAFPGLVPDARGLVARGVFDAVLAPGDLILLTSWRTGADAQAFERIVYLPSNARLRRVRVVRDYGMFDRREAPQSYPAVERAGADKSLITPAQPAACVGVPRMVAAAAVRWETATPPPSPSWRPSCRSSCCWRSGRRRSAHARCASAPPSATSLLGVAFAASGLGSVVGSGSVEALAGLGVVFLLFDIRLHVSLRLCRNGGRTPHPAGAGVGAASCGGVASGNERRAKTTVFMPTPSLFPA